MTVSLPSGTISADVIVKAVERAGMQAEVWSDHRDEATGFGLWQRRRRTILTASSGLLTLAGFLYSWASVGCGLRSALKGRTSLTIFPWQPGCSMASARWPAGGLSFRKPGWLSVASGQT